MSPEEPLYTILEYILNRATSAELEVIAEALQRRQSSAGGFGGFSPRNMAENVAEKVKEQLGSMLDVRSISRQIVTDLIRQKEPNISDQELEVLLNHWLPGAAESRSTPAEMAETLQQNVEEAETVAPDVLITMISQYVAARQGTMSPEEQARLPKDWQNRYWESFPEQLRVGIREHLQGKLSQVEFWKQVISSLDR
jgi:hypothetical protein